MRYLDQAFAFLADTLLGTYLLLVLLRLLFQMVRADFYNPLAQFLVRATNPVVLPLRRLLPGYLGIDWASVLVLLVLMIFKVMLAFWIAGVPAPATASLVLATGQILELTIYVFLIAVFVRAALSWITPYGQHPTLDLLASLTEPLLAPARRWVPPIGGFDLSPLAVMIVLELSLILLVQPILDFGARLVVS